MKSFYKLLKQSKASKQEVYEKFYKLLKQSKAKQASKYEKFKKLLKQRKQGFWKMSCKREFYSFEIFSEKANIL